MLINFRIAVVFCKPVSWESDDKISKDIYFFWTRICAKFLRENSIKERAEFKDLGNVCMKWLNNFFLC